MFEIQEYNNGIYRFLYDKDGLKIDCRLKPFHDILKVNFFLWHYNYETDPVIIRNLEISAQAVVDEFMDMLSNCLVIEEGYYKIVVCPGQHVLNNYIRKKYNLEYDYYYE